MTELLEKIAPEEHFLLGEPEHVERTKGFRGTSKHPALTGAPLP